MTCDRDREVKFQNKSRESRLSQVTVSLGAVHILSNCGLGLGGLPYLLQYYIREWGIPEKSIQNVAHLR